MNKFLIIIFIALFSFVGCMNGNNTKRTALTDFTIETIAMQIGYEVAKLPPNVDLALRNVYTLATEGKLTVEGINEISAALKQYVKTNPILINRFVKLIELAGGQVYNGNVVSIVNIDPEILKIIADAYVEGFNLRKNE